MVVVRLAERWRRLASSAGLHAFEETGAALIAAYSEPHRRYHGLSHVAYLLDELERRAPMIGDPTLLRFAAWFHDAVYDPLARDNEARSAVWAERDLAACGLAAPAAGAVARLILKTRSHHAGEATSDEALFLDIDFSILGAERGAYTAYADAIRAEYAAVPDDAFRSGRAAFLGGVLAQPRMFRTDVYEREIGAQARANIAWELARLTS